jgi:hypothetical protein
VWLAHNLIHKRAALHGNHERSPKMNSNQT